MHSSSSSSGIFSEIATKHCLGSTRWHEVTCESMFAPNHRSQTDHSKPSMYATRERITCIARLSHVRSNVLAKRGWVADQTFLPMLHLHVFRHNVTHRPSEHLHRPIGLASTTQDKSLQTIVAVRADHSKTSLSKPIIAVGAWAQSYLAFK